MNANTNPLAAKIKTFKTSEIEEMIRLIGKAADGDTLTVRIYLFNEYEKRVGGEATDKLLDELSL